MSQGAAAMLLLVVVMATEVPWLLADPTTECRESEYLDPHGQCQPCRECGPGLELSKECGYGEGSQAQCVPCQPRRFKHRWGHHGCQPCLSCTLINRVQTANCTATADAICGACVPGFYSKTQIGGLRDLECVPCTRQTPPSETQCRSTVRLVEVDDGPPTAAGRDLPLMVLTSGALLIIVLVLLTVSILYCQRFWKDQCQRVFARSRDFPEQRVTFQPPARPAGFSCRETVLTLPCLHLQNFGPGHRPAEDYNEEVRFGPHVETPGLCHPCPQPDVEFSRLMAPASKGPPSGAPHEAQPLIRNSGCSDCSAGGSSFTEFRQDPGGDPNGPGALSSCATEVQGRWPHAPVECTELDLQKLSAQVEFVGSSSSSSRVAPRQLRGRAEGPWEGPLFATAGKGLPLPSAQETSLSFRSPAVESGEQLGEDVQSLVAKIGDMAQDLTLASLPNALVLSLACQLDPPLPGLKNFIPLGKELGVPPHQLRETSGFVELVAHLSRSGRPLPVATLARALQKLQRFDALLLLYDHFAGSQIQEVRP